MQLLSIILSLLSILMFFGAFVGLIKPSLLNETSRLKAFGQSMAISIFFFVLAVIFMPEVEDAEIAQTSDTTDTIVVDRNAQVELAPEPEPTTIMPKAHGYTVVYARDHSILAEDRKGGLWYIVSDAETMEDRALTMIQAAKDLHSEMLEPTHAFIWLFANDRAAEQGLGNVGTASYVPDGQGRLSGFPNDSVWDINVSDFVETELQTQIRDLWIDNRSKHVDADKFLKEDALRAEIAQTLAIGNEELSSALFPLFAPTLQAYQYDGAAYEVLAGKADSSIQNPDDFMTDQCMENLRCWAEKHSVSGAVYCEPHVERSAKYDFEWTDSWLESKFSHFRWLNAENRKAGIVTYIGDKVKFQNGFGAWLPITYECDFDPINGTVLDLRLYEGRL